LKAITREQLYDHYRTYYVPNNALAVAVGDFQAEEMVELIERHLGGVDAGPEVPAVRAVEPLQRGERRVTVRRQGFVPYLSVAFHTPSVHDDDFYALAVLNAILTGASSMTFMGSGLTNKSSRLYQALVDRELAVDVSGFLLPSIDRYPYTLSVVVRPDQDPEIVEQTLDGELERVMSDAVDQNEVDKAIKQAKAQFAYSKESVTGQALWLGFSEIFADHAWAEAYLGNLEGVTVEDVRRAARTYLAPDNRTVGWYLPTGGAGAQARQGTGS
jgi:zinc protease